MCIFSGKVQEVSGTQIFARGEGSKQYLVYSMQYETPNEVAMILPIPVAEGAGDDAVHFINLEDYPQFFKDLDRCFEEPRSRGGDMLKSFTKSKSLRIVEVGNFIASFIPTLNDFDRLDSKFKLDRAVWDGLPEYASYGFVVFQLKPSVDLSRVHPMAFDFPRKNPDVVFFPTVHIHDGKVHKTARFDHALYAQFRRPLTMDKWRGSDHTPGAMMDIVRTQGTVTTDRVYRLKMKEVHRNSDVLVLDAGSKV